MKGLLRKVCARGVVTQRSSEGFLSRDYCGGFAAKGLLAYC